MMTNVNTFSNFIPSSVLWKYLDLVSKKINVCNPTYTAAASLDKKIKKKWNQLFNVFIQWYFLWKMPNFNVCNFSNFWWGLLLQHLIKIPGQQNYDPEGNWKMLLIWNIWFVSFQNLKVWISFLCRIFKFNF